MVSNNLVGLIFCLGGIAFKLDEIKHQLIAENILEFTIIGLTGMFG